MTFIDAGGQDLSEFLEELNKQQAEYRQGVVRECVAWLAMHYDDFKPEYLAGEMAKDLLPDHS